MFEPNEAEIAWAEFMVQEVGQDGVWFAPSTGQHYIFNHDKRTIELQNPQILGNALAADWHFKNSVTFAKLGYTVTEKGAKAA